ncbi:hypothetical protein BG015_001840 [Linnemannia schmuckeri]|uniref:Uncharacterized protein n=1 Tax=Linnemannia schmuckeri TaxID=64567 RepID=A0A9P5V681_9FUNG|nr:hypothetical protein BG015_001840 [Linnemannia schmuckeri]
MSFPPRFIRTQTPHALRSSLKRDSVDGQIHNSNSDNLFQDLDNHHSENDDNDEDNDDEDRTEGREQSDSMIDLNEPSSPPTSLPRFAFLSAPTAPTTTTPGNSFALLADKTSKRVRVTADPAASSQNSNQRSNRSRSRSRSRSTTPILSEIDDNDYKPATSSPSKRVRFDESKNRVHWHHRSSSISPPGSPVASINLKTQPLVSALLRRSQYRGNQSPSASFDFDESFTSVGSSTSSNGSGGNQSPEKFTLSLENTSQDIMDFTSSLTRLMGSGTLEGSQESDTSSTSGISFAAFNSPLPMSASSRVFSNMFQASPPSPVRPSFMSYSPPPSSSLSSCWSPTMDDDEDDSMETAPRISPPPPPVPVQKKARAPFVPRRPRNTGNLSPTRPGAVPGAPRRFPSMLKREASNASFLDNYPASLAPGPGDDDYNPSSSSTSRVSPPPPAAATVVPRMSTPPREASVSPVLQSFSLPATPAVSLPLLSAGAAATTPLLRKSISDIPLRSLKNSSNSSFWLDAQKIVPQFKKSASFNEFMDTCNSNNNSNNYKNLSQEDVIMSLAPLFPLQNSTPADSQLV